MRVCWCERMRYAGVRKYDGVRVCWCESMCYAGVVMCGYATEKVCRCEIMLV